MKALHPEPDFILWTGDDTPHVADEKLGEDAVLRIISKLTKLIQVVFPGTKVYSAMGNHDFHPKNQFPGNYHKIYNRTAELWAPWMDHQSITLFNQGAFYTEKLLGQNDQRIIVLNTNLYYRSNKLNVETNDPAGQFQWLEEVLSNAIVAKEKVYIIGHVPPGFFEKKRWTSWFLEHFNSRYVEIIQKYHSVIAGQFFGHHHTDSFRMFYNQSGSPIGVMFVTPGITPWKTTLPGVENGANNPAIRIFEYNTYTLEIQAGDYFWGAAVLCLVLFCSVVVQLFSWFWFAGDREQLKSLSDSGLLPSFKTTVGDGALRLLHGLQLGFLVRYITALEVGIRMHKERDTFGLQYVIYLISDISMLRLFESIFESAPQLSLMLYIMMLKNQMKLHQCFSIVASFLSIAWAVLDFHKSLRSSLSDKMHLRFKSAVTYFIFNLLLICPRICSIALFAIIFKHYVLLHFALICLPMFIWTCQQGTDFMNNLPEEVFYRGAVAVILYFTWLNVAEGKTFIRQVIYHSFLAVDCGILVGFWWIYRDPVLTASYALPLLFAISSSYFLGVIVKCTYYKYLHPRVTADLLSTDEIDVLQEVGFRSICESRPLINKRMQILSNCFYSSKPGRNKCHSDMEETKI
ncbi:acid sphingomyelinase-like phosphodiesterase 3b isoform X2 [Stegostoma tigrinum]|nr:acid sphingomyelinase-like phosphodiesterase 3b isoform X2 [Stegostoma tigrinum]